MEGGKSDAAETNEGKGQRTKDHEFPAMTAKRLMKLVRTKERNSKTSKTKFWG